MSQLIKIDQQYSEWIQNISARYKQSQIKASMKVNNELLLFYWSLGKDIVEMKAENKWGTSFVDNLSQDLKEQLPNVKGFSRRNIFYIIKFYRLYCDMEIVHQLGAQINSNTIFQQTEQNEFLLLFNIPWGHHKLIMDKCKSDQNKALFFVKKVIENNWSRAVLMNFLDTALYERDGVAITNFSSTLPEIESDLAQELTKDPYNFDFLTIRKGYDEKELKDALLDNIQRFLLELGKGFAFVGREYRLTLGNTEEFVDMLFYNIRLHCYVVIEVKVVDFKPADIGQLGTYVTAVNHILKQDSDNKTIGLIICKTKDNVLAQYALESSSQPIGISEYELSSLLPENFQSSMPTIEEIEQELKTEI